MKFENQQRKFQMLLKDGDLTDKHSLQAKLIAKKYLMAQLGQSAEDVAIHEEY